MAASTGRFKPLAVFTERSNFSHCHMLCFVINKQLKENLKNLTLSIHLTLFQKRVNLPNMSTLGFFFSLFFFFFFVFFLIEIIFLCVLSNKSQSVNLSTDQIRCFFVLEEATVDLHFWLRLTHVVCNVRFLLS